MKGTREFFETIKYQLDKDGIETDMGFYDEDSNVATIKMKNKGAYHLSHITAFITSYARIRLLNTLRKINPNDVLKVVGDGIYFINGDSYDMNHLENETYRLKELENEKGILLNSSGFFCNSGFHNEIRECGENKPH